ncbi:rod-binding protein [Pseudoroseomonas sp. WGS1072]|uniref:rod-binding protein n=1 Tax=Roseomonas sp. WGS1072 TaxID=3366816 RepID=UPI003BF0CD88
MDASINAAPPATARRLARQLESGFAAEMLRAARPPQKSGLSGRGTGAQAFDSFMDEALGGALVSQGGLGLTPVIERAIAARQAPPQPGAAR